MNWRGTCAGVGRSKGWCDWRQSVAWTELPPTRMRGKPPHSGARAPIPLRRELTPHETLPFNKSISGGCTRIRHSTVSRHQCGKINSDQRETCSSQMPINISISMGDKFRNVFYILSLSLGVNSFISVYARCFVLLLTLVELKGQVYSTCRSTSLGSEFLISASFS